MVNDASSGGSSTSLNAREQRLAEAILQCEALKESAQSPSAIERWLEAFASVGEELQSHIGNDLLLAELIRDALCGGTPGGASATTEGHGAAASAEEFPARLGDYELIRELGRGGMGVVFLARQCSLDRLVAVKLMHRAGFASAADRARFQQEAELAANLRHPNIVRIHEVGESAGQLYFSMDLIQGPSLAKRQKTAPLDLDEAAGCVAAVARAVEFAHAQQIVHRDLKPGNVLCDGDTGGYLVADFGLAKRLESAEDGLTETGQRLGTPAYMAPEQMRPSLGEIGPHTDVYGLGALLYELLTGNPPFRGEPFDVQRQILFDPPPAPRTLNSRVPRDLQTIAMKCLEKAPRDRYATAEAVADDLRRYLRREPIRAVAATRMKRTWRWCQRNRAVAVTIGAAVVVTLLVTAAIGYFAATWAERSERDALLRALALSRAEAEQRAAERPGWRERAYGHLRAAAELGESDELRAAWSTAAMGIDASVAYEESDRPASAVGFDEQGDLVVAGDGNRSPYYLDWRQGRRRELDCAGCVLVTFDDAEESLGVRYGGGSTVEVVEMETGRVASRLVMDGGNVTDSGQDKSDERRARHIAASRGGRRIAAVIGGSPETTHVVVWERSTGKAIFRQSVGATSIVISPDGSRLAAGDETGRVLVWTIDSPGPPTILDTQRKAAVHALLFADPPGLAQPKGGDAGNAARIFIGGFTGWLEQWDLAAKRRIVTYKGNMWDVSVLALSPDGTLLASGGRDTILWDAVRGERLLNLTKSYAVTSLAFSGDGAHLAVGTRAYAAEAPPLTVWRIERGDGGDVLYGLESHVTQTHFSPDGRRLAALGQDWTLAIWDSDSRQLLARLTPDQTGTFADNSRPMFNADASLIAMATERSAYLWNVSTGELLCEPWRFAASGLSNVVAFHPSGALLCFRAEEKGKVLRFYELPRSSAPRLIRSEYLPGGEQYADTATAASGRWIAVEWGRRDAKSSLLRRTLGVFDLLTGERRFVFRAPPSISPIVPRPLPRNDQFLMRVQGETWIKRFDAFEKTIAFHRILESVDAQAEWEADVGESGEARFRATGNPQDWLPLGRGVEFYARPQFNADGKRLAWGTTDGRVFAFDVARLVARVRDKR